MQSTLGVGADRDSVPGRVGPLLLAGVALAGTGLVGVTPTAPAGPQAQHLAVQLTSGFDDVVADYQSVFSTATTNLQQLATDAQAAGAELSQQLGSIASGYGDLLSTAFNGVLTNLGYVFDGGWYGGDDGFVFGLFGGTVTHGDVTASGSTLQEIADALAQGNLFDAYGVFDKWSLEAFDHVSKALVSPFVSTSTDAPTIPGDFLHNLANIYDTFGTYSFLKGGLAEGLMAPFIGVNAGLTQAFDTIGGDLSSGNIEQPFFDALKVPGDVIGDVLNGFVQVNPFNGDDTPFAGLINDGSFLYDLLVNWPQLLVTGLDGSAFADDAGSAAAAAGGDVVDGLFGLL